MARMADLRIELARGTEGQNGLVPGGLLKRGGDLLHRGCKIGRNGDLDLTRLHRTGKKPAGSDQGQSPVK